MAAALMLGLAACGDDDDEGTGTGATGTGTQEEQAAPQGSARQTLTVSETEYEIDPSKIDVAEAGVIEFQVENTGEQTHALEIESRDLEEETGEIAPGESASLKVELKAGTYELYCPIGDHKEQGMTGELVVAGGGGASADDSGGASPPEDSEDDDSGY